MQSKAIPMHSKQKNHAFEAKNTETEYCGNSVSTMPKKTLSSQFLTHAKVLWKCMIQLMLEAVQFFTISNLLPENTN